MRIAVCDVGLGNLRSVERALREATRGRRIDVEVTGDPARIGTADRLVMPGQAGFGPCARALSGVLNQPNVFYIGFDNGGVWRSTDFGSTWVAWARSERPSSEMSVMRQRDRRSALAGIPSPHYQLIFGKMFDQLIEVPPAILLRIFDRFA